MKNNRLIVAICIPFLLSCGVADGPFSSDSVSGTSDQAVGSDLAVSSSVSETISEESKGDDVSSSDGENCGTITHETGYWGFIYGHAYDMSEKPTITVEYARRREGYYHLTLFEGSNRSEGIRIYSDYFSKADVVRCYPNGGDLVIPSTYKTFSVDFDLNILTTLSTNSFALAMCDDGPWLGGELWPLRFSFTSDGCVIIRSC